MEENLKKKLLGIGLKEEDLADITLSYDQLVESEVQSRLVDERIKMKKELSEKANDFVEKKVNAELEKKTVELENLAEEYSNKKAATLAKKADEKINEEISKVEDSAAKYIDQYFNEAFDEKFKSTLQNIEESVISSVDQYLDVIINEKISNDVITSAAMNETLQPIVEGVQKLFAEHYVPLNNSGTAKLDGAKKEISSLEESLKEQVKANVKLATDNERYQKTALIAEKCSELSNGNRIKLKKFFENKPFTIVKSDIDEYKLMLENESAEKAKLISEKAEAERKLNMRRVEQKETVKPLSERVISHTPEKIHENKETSLNEHVVHKFRAPREDAESALYTRVATLL